MANIKEIILNKYNIDIDETNILKLYKIDSADISSVDLEIKIEKCRRKWNQSINGANERFAERAKAYLEKANIYEQILRNDNLRKDLFAYHDKADSSNINTSFAKKYFKLVSSTKRITKKDVDFFFKYYQNERKNKKSILEMLKTEFKVYGLGKEDKYASEDEEVETTEKKTNSYMVVNSFQETTIIKIHKCEQCLENALTSSDVKSRYPKAEEGLYSFLEIENYENLNTFISDVSKRREEAANYRLDRGQDFNPVVDLFNTMSELIEHKDVIDNFFEFKLLLKYPKLSPFMFAFNELNKSSLDDFFNFANKEYPFDGQYDFVETYFLSIYDNFGISVNNIKKIIKDAKKQAKADAKSKRIERTYKVPFGIGIIYYAVYWPIYILYLVFETFKAIITEMRIIAYPLFAALFLGINWLAGDDNLLALRYVFNPDKLSSLVTSFFGEHLYGFEFIVSSIIMVLAKLISFILPPLLISLLFYRLSEQFSQSVEWIGLERTFETIFKTLKMKTKKQYTENKKEFFKKKIPSIFINVFCVFIIGVMIHFAPIAKTWVIGMVGFFDSKSETVTDVVGVEINDTYMVITANKANIRSGAGTSYGIITAVEGGTQFVWTGNQADAENGNTWYEIYLDSEKSQTGWASMSVIDFIEK